MPEKESEPFESRDLLSIKQAAKYLGPGVTERLIRRYIYEYRTLKPVQSRHKTKCFIRKSDLDQLFGQGPT
jgi:hypothetical protein